MTVAVEIADHMWVVDERPSWDAAGLILAALTVDEAGYRRHDTGRLVAALLVLAAEAERDRLRDWLLDERCTVPDRLLAEIMIYVVESICERTYAQARSLVAVAFSNWRYWRGRLLLRGLRPEDLSLVDVVDCVYALMLEDAERRGVKVSEIAERVDQLLADLWLDRETWGNDVTAEAMMVPAPEPIPRRT